MRRALGVIPARYGSTRFPGKPLAPLKDGTLIRLGSGQEPDRVDLTEAFDKSAAVTVYLAVPKLALGRRTVAEVVPPRPSDVVTQPSSRTVDGGRAAVTPEALSTARGGATPWRRRSRSRSIPSQRNSKGRSPNPWQA